MVSLSYLILSLSLSSLIKVPDTVLGVCKRRAGDSSVEELAMHRKLSEFVTTAFAAKSMQSIMTSMMQAAVEVAPPLTAATNRKKSAFKSQPYIMDIQ